MLSSAQDWWEKPEWTNEHYRLARRIMRSVHVLPPDWAEDVIQEVALRYPRMRSTGRGGDYTAWLRTILHRKSIDIYRKEFHLRTKESNRPLLVSLESLGEFAVAAPITRSFDPSLLESLRESPNR